MDGEKRNQVIAIEGNTGCGKTRLLQWLSTFSGVQTYNVKYFIMYSEQYVK